MTAGKAGASAKDDTGVSPLRCASVEMTALETGGKGRSRFPEGMTERGRGNGEARSCADGGSWEFG